MLKQGRAIVVQWNSGLFLNRPRFLGPVVGEYFRNGRHGAHP